MSPSTVAIVTGANKGIGLAIVKHLALQYPKSAANNGSFLVYLTARDKGRGEAALQSLLQDDQLQRAKALSKDGGPTEVKYHPLDISQTKSIHDIRDFIKREHPEGIDILVNNAGIAMDGFNEHVVETTLACNYYGTLEACNVFLPLLKPHARLVNVASIAGQLSRYSPAVRSAFESSTSVPEVTSLMERFKTAVAAGREKQEGFVSAAYAVSKAGEIAMTRALARAEVESGGTRLINACCPGWVATDMTKYRGTKSVDEGAQTPVLLALGDVEGKSGLFWQEERPSKW